MRGAAVRPVGGCGRGRRGDARTLCPYDMGVVRRDDGPGQRAAGRHPPGGRHAIGADVDDEHRRVHVERRRRRAARHHRPLRARRPAREDDRDGRADGAPPTVRPVLQLVRPPHGREADDLAAERRPAHAGPLLGRQRLAGHRAADRPQHRAGAVGARGCDLRVDGLRALLRAVGQPDHVPLRAVHRRGGVLLRHGRLREPDRGLHRDREGRAAGQGVLRPLALLPGRLRLVLAGDAAGRLQPQLRGRQRLRRRLPVRRDACDAELGRLDVRGADAGAVRARGALGRRLVAPEPPAHRGRADRPRARGGRVRHVGLLAVQRPGGRLHRVRRRRDRAEPGRLPLQRGRHARRSRLRGLPRSRPRARPAAERLHQRRGHAARLVPGAALPAAAGDREPRAAGVDPGRVRRVGLRRLGQRRHALPVARLPVARPGDDHGRARQRAR